MSKIAGIYWDDTAAAPGISLSVYFSGCHFHCRGCHNPEAQDFNYGNDFTEELQQEIITKLTKNGVQRALSILGGEPLAPENRKDVLKLVDICRENNQALVVYLWTGYTLQEILDENDPTVMEIIGKVDCWIDGRFEIEKRDITLPLRGSSNQNIYYNTRNEA